MPRPYDSWGEKKDHQIEFIFCKEIKTFRQKEF